MSIPTAASAAAIPTLVSTTTPSAPKPRSWADIAKTKIDTTPQKGRKLMFILRGLPGAGKTTRARELKKECASEGCAILSADDFFLYTVGGKVVYRFDPTQLQMAHDMAVDRTRQEAEKGTPTIVIDNTNAKRRDFQQYLDIAKLHGYQVVEEIVGGLTTVDVETYTKRCVHNVPKHTIAKMASEFEY